MSDGLPQDTCSLLANGAISWSSKKQSCIALSTMEAEFVAFCSTAHGRCLVEAVFGSAD